MTNPEPTLMGIPAADAVGHGYGATWVDTQHDRWLINDYGENEDGELEFTHSGIENGKIFFPNGSDRGIIQLLYCESAPNPMDRAPRCGGEVLLVVEDSFNSEHVTSKFTVGTFRDSEWKLPDLHGSCGSLGGYQKIVGFYVIPGVKYDWDSCAG